MHVVRPVSDLPARRTRRLRSRPLIATFTLAVALAAAACGGSGGGNGGGGSTTNPGGGGGGATTAPLGTGDSLGTSGTTQ